MKAFKIQSLTLAAAVLFSASLPAFAAKKTSHNIYANPQNFVVIPTLIYSSMDWSKYFISTKSTRMSTSVEGEYGLTENFSLGLKTQFTNESRTDTESTGSQNKITANGLENPEVFAKARYYTEYANFYGKLTGAFAAEPRRIQETIIQGYGLSNSTIEMNNSSGASTAKLTLGVELPFSGATVGGDFFSDIYSTDVTEERTIQYINEYTYKGKPGSNMGALVFGELNNVGIFRPGAYFKYLDVGSYDMTATNDQGNTLAISPYSGQIQRHTGIYSDIIITKQTVMNVTLERAEMNDKVNVQNAEIYTINARAAWAF